MWCVSCVTCHVSHVNFFNIIFLLSGEPSRWRVCYQRGLPRLVFFWILTAFFLKDKSRNLFKLVSVLLSAAVERVGVSRMRDSYGPTSSCANLVPVSKAEC